MEEIVFLKLAATEPTKPFRSTNPALTQYFETRLDHDIRTRQAQAHGLFLGEELVGIVTISNASVERGSLSNRSRRSVGLNRGAYPVLPAMLIGRLAIAMGYTGRGYGKALLARTLILIRETAEVSGCAVVVVDPIDEVATDFYRKAQFRELHADASGRLFLLVEEIPIVRDVPGRN